MLFSIQPSTFNIMITYARPRLLTEDDRRYRAYVDGFKLQRKNNKATRPPRQRNLFGGEAEAALRGWLAPRVELDERRIIEYEERRNKRAFVKYREVDALAVDERSIWAFEFKASRSASSLRRAVGQLQETRQILRLLRHNVRVTIMLVDTGIPASAEQVDALMASDRPPSRRPELLSEALAALPILRLVELAGRAGRRRDDRRAALLGGRYHRPGRRREPAPRLGRRRRGARGVCRAAPGLLALRQQLR